MTIIETRRSIGRSVLMFGVLLPLALGCVDPNAWGATAPVSTVPSPTVPRITFAGSIQEVSATPASIPTPTPTPTATAGISPSHKATVVRTSLRSDEHAATTTFEVALRMRNFDDLQARIARGEQIPRDQMEASYYPTIADHDRLVNWLKGQGLTVTRTDGNRLAVFGRGTVDAVAQAFQVTFARVAKDGAEYTSAITAPSLPADIAPSVLGIHGLQPHIRPRRLSSPRASRPNVTTTGNKPPYLPAQIAQAYGAGGVTQTGAGQTIAIYAFAFPTTKDLNTFWTTAGVAQTAANVTDVTVAGGPASESYEDGYGEEVSLDTEWSGALAPGAALRIYGANENDPADNDEILQQVFADLPNNPSIHQLCICIGGSEAEVDHDYLIIEAQYMANLASAGVTIFSASGDSGAYTDNILQVTTPTSDPDVTGVGGTTLVLGTTGTVSSETAWSDSGGGVSVVFPRPSWQTGGAVLAGQTMRCVPDVAATADPNDGAVIVFDGKQSSIGGTSWGAPIWSGFCALINQARAAAGQSAVGLLNSTIYPLSGTSAFRDITSGSNGYYSATTGYDLVTGLGVPNVAGLMEASLTSSAAPLVPAQLGNRFTTLGQPATFFVVAYGAAPISYQWQRMPAGTSAWTTLSDDGTYSGSATSTLVVSGTTLAMSGDQFQCIVSNALGSAVSSPAAALTVNPVGVSTFAGWPGSAGSVNGTGWAARFDEPGSVRASAAGIVYVGDSYNDTVRMITPAGVVTTLAGTPGVAGATDGPASTALFNGVGGVAPDATGDVYVADSLNYTIRMISAAGTVSTLAGTAGSSAHVDGTGTAARFSDPENLALDASGNIYVADGIGNTIRKVTPAGVVTTLAGSGARGSINGTGTGATFDDLTGISVDASGNVYVADNGNNLIRKITQAGVVTTLAGSGRSGSADGTGTSATFDAPSSVAVDSDGDVYVSDAGNSTIREISPAGVVTTVAGSPGAIENIDGVGAAARFDAPGDVAVDPSGVVYVADTLNNTIRRLVPGAYSAPAIVTQPQSQSANLGASVTFSVVATGSAPLAYQWYFAGQPIPGANAATYTVADVQSTNGGAYTVVVSNSAGSVTSSAATLTPVLPAGSPAFTTQPQGATLSFGGSVVLTAAVTGNAPLSYQWQLNGTAIAGATASTYTATAPGSYTVLASNAISSVVSNAAVVPAANRLVDISSRAFVGAGGSIEIAGFVIDGPPGIQKQVLIRGVGPALANYGVTGVLAQPTISIANSAGTIIDSNTGWGTASNAAQMPEVAASVGDVIPFVAGSADSALLVSLAPGPYTVELSGVGGATGEGLVEVYEVNIADPDLVADISTRALVGTGQNILIAGFVVQGTQPATVLIRGDGPALVNYGVTGVLAQPVLTVINNATNGTVGTNTGWGTASNAAQMPSVATAVGSVIPFTSGSADSALLLNLPPGSYSAEVSGANGTTGVALVEVYQAPPQ